MKTVSDKTVLIWNTASTMIDAAFSVLLIMVVVRKTGAEESDMFSIAFSLATLLAAIGNFQVRVFQATDISESYCFASYFAFRIVTCSVMAVAAVGTVLYRHYTGEKAWLVLLLCLFRLIDCLADVYGGLFQQKQHMEISCKGNAARWLGSMIVFVVCLYLTENLVLACGLLVITSVMIFSLYTVPQYQKHWKNQEPKPASANALLADCSHIFWDCLPLFINGFLLLYLYNIPKDLIDSAVTQGRLETGLQTVYNICFMPASVINLLLLIFRQFLTKMAVFWKEKCYSGFQKMVTAILLILVFVCPVVLVGGNFLGIPILQILYNQDLSGYQLSFMILLLGGCLNTIAAYFNNVVTVIRCQKWLLLSYIGSVGLAMTVGKNLVLHHGILGASCVYLLGAFSLAVMNSLIFLVGYRQTKQK